MADSLIDLDPVANVFDPEVDWETQPAENKDMQLNVDVYPGTIHSINFFQEPKRQFKIKISDYERQLYSFLIFFADQVGRYKRFWYPDQQERFIPASIASDFLSMEVEKIPNLHLHGHERIFLRMKNGDRISRKIEVCTQLPNSTKFEFEIALPEIVVADIEFATLFFLVRCASDEIEIEYNGRIPSLEITFVELLEEYDSSGV